MKSHIYQFILIAIFSLFNLFSCQSNKAEENKKNILPNLITSKSIGEINFCEIGDDFWAKKRPLDTLFFEEEETTWIGVKQKISNEEWILYELNGPPEEKYVMRVHTNSPKYQNAEGIRVGFSVSKVISLTSNYSFSYELNKLSMLLYEDMTYLSIDDPKFDSMFQKKGIQESEVENFVDVNSLITEITVIPECEID